jgi:hypothetical protein
MHLCERLHMQNVQFIVIQVPPADKLSSRINTGRKSTFPARFSASVKLALFYIGLEVMTLCFEACVTLWDCVYIHTSKLLKGNGGIFSWSFSKACGLFTYTSLTTCHTKNSQRFKLGDHGGHNPWLTTHSSNTSFTTSQEFFCVCHWIILHNMPVRFSLVGQLVEEKWKNQSHITFGIYCFVKKHGTLYLPRTNCTQTLNFKYALRQIPSPQQLAGNSGRNIRRRRRVNINRSST